MAKLERLDKIVANMGYGTRKEVKKFIKDGLISINGEIVTDNKTKLDPYNNEILFNGQNINYREYIYLMMNKPQGFVSSTDDPISRTVIDILEYQHQIFEPFPVGRLDKDTEGLLLITNDGKLAHNLLSPNKEVNKIYYAEVNSRVEDRHIDKFREGVTFLDDGYKTKPGDLEIIESGDNSKVYVTIQEGKFHQVKRMFEAIGMTVTYLKRLQMGSLELDEDLELGEYRELTKEGLEGLMNL